jgi:hypothetical protein
MKILIEGEKYHIELLESIFEDPKFYTRDGQDGSILSVGYYHSYDKNELIYMLPKVFMKNNTETIFGVSKDDLYNLETSSTFKHKSEFNWIRQISIFFYNSLVEFRKRNKLSTISKGSSTSDLNTNLNDHEYSYLDLLLSFVNFYKKNNINILYKHIEYQAQQARNPNWDKTIRKSLPMLTKSKQPVYSIFRNKKKILNTEEELLIYFFSILNHFNVEHNLYLHIDKSFKLIKGTKFESLQQNGLTKLRKIKYRYFNDTLKRMYNLCEIYFSKTDTSSIKKGKEEFISINNYNLIFEDMVDKLFSDPIKDKRTSEGVSLKSLKYNDDGKIVDHIFDHQSLLDTSDIFYIGDSKYYKPNNTAGKISKYKQFTYAKNVIQYNIDMLNEEKSYTENIRYRDELTEGYNITPNFFIYAYIDDYHDFDDSGLTVKNNIQKSFHFEKRLFDRDTLFVHQYKVNFLFILKSYTHNGLKKIEQFRNTTKNMFRENFLTFFNSPEKSEFTFYEYKKDDISVFVEVNFRTINGKCFVTNNNKLILAKHNSDESMTDLLVDFYEYNLK